MLARAGLGLRILLPQLPGAMITGDVLTPNNVFMKAFALTRRTWFIF